MIDFTEIFPQLTPDVQIETDWSGGRTGLAADVKKRPESNGKVGLVGFSNGGILATGVGALDRRSQRCVRRERCVLAPDHANFGGRLDTIKTRTNTLKGVLGRRRLDVCGLQREVI